MRGEVNMEGLLGKGGQFVLQHWCLGLRGQAVVLLCSFWPLAYLLPPVQACHTAQQFWLMLCLGQLRRLIKAPWLTLCSGWSYAAIQINLWWLEGWSIYLEYHLLPTGANSNLAHFLRLPENVGKTPSCPWCHFMSEQEWIWHYKSNFSKAVRNMTSNMPMWLQSYHR